ncbi:hypothetical protein [Haloquadratum walsbyi]|jgi:hypothetical protein|uniref:CopG domain protein n=1 Tax=Haloquadratum walsbyi (strain DSM 16790 / HBSQ001) TaxID=362976 RepID=Q18I53_HALWD|nr:hypothetical protein [Haloquadratum walsbyi]CAJ52324.1 CopG domain protein [Haloquadratum walsbyi DSM 16790]
MVSERNHLAFLCILKDGGNSFFEVDVDATWENLGYKSRSEFVCDVLRDAVKHPEFNRADLKAIAASEVDIQEGRTHSSEEIKAKYGREDTTDR